MPVTIETLVGYGLIKLRKLKEDYDKKLKKRPKDKKLIDENEKIIQAIELAEAAYRAEHLLEAIGEYLNSEEGIASLIEASEMGLPAIQGVDIRLQEIFGQQYNSDGATNSCGHRIAKIMESMNYIQQPVRQLPVDEGYVATNGHVYTLE